MGFVESTVDAVRNDPDVAVAVPLMRGTVGVAAAPGQTLQLFGAELTAEEELRRYGIRIEIENQDPFVLLNDPKAIALPEGLAARLRKRIADGIALPTPVGIVDLTLRGLLAPEGLAPVFGGEIALMDLFAAQRILAKEQRISSARAGPPRTPVEEPCALPPYVTSFLRARRRTPGFLRRFAMPAARV